MSDLGRKLEPFSVTSEQRGHAAHLRVFGEIDMATAPILERWFQAAESNGNAAIIVDLEQVTFIDASGLRPFLGAAQRASRSGRTFAVTRAQSLVLRLFRITGTTHLLAADALGLSSDRPSEEHSYAMQAMAGGGSDVSSTRDGRVAQAAR